jgi:hypothetical protein
LFPQLEEPTKFGTFSLHGTVGSDVPDFAILPNLDNLAEQCCVYGSDENSSVEMSCEFPVENVEFLPGWENAPKYWPHGEKPNGHFVQTWLNLQWAQENDTHVLCGACWGFWWLADHPYAKQRIKEMECFKRKQIYQICDKCNGHFYGHLGKAAKFSGYAMHPVWGKLLVYLGGGMQDRPDKNGVPGVWVYNYPLFDFTYPTDTLFFPKFGEWPPSASFLQKAENDQMPTLATQPRGNWPLTVSNSFDKSEMDSNIPLQQWRGGCCLAPLPDCSDFGSDLCVEPEFLSIDHGPDSSKPPEYLSWTS